MIARVFIGTIVSCALIALVYHGIAKLNPHEVSRLKLEQNFWVPGTTGINTENRTEMNAWLLSYGGNKRVAVVSFLGSGESVFWRFLDTNRAGVVDFNLNAEMTVVIIRNPTTGKLSVKPL